MTAFPCVTFAINYFQGINIEPFAARLSELQSVAVLTFSTGLCSAQTEARKPLTSSLSFSLFWQSVSFVRLCVCMDVFT